MPSEQETYQQQVLSADRAAAYLEDDVFKNAVAKIAERCIEDWRTSQPSETAKRDAAYNTLRALDALTNEIKSVVDGGKVARAHLQRQGLGRKN